MAPAKPRKRRPSKRSPGRPPGDPNKSRTTGIEIVLSQDEVDRINRVVDELGERTRSEWARRLLLAEAERVEADLGLQPIEDT